MKATAGLTQSVSRAGPLRQKPFRRFLSGHFVSLVGDYLYFVALPWAAIQQGSSGAVVGVLLATAATPRVLLMLGGGVVVDRIGSRLVMLSSDLLRSVVMVGAALMVFAGLGGVAGLFVVAALFGLVDAFFHPALGALVPDLVPRDALPAANGLRTLALRTAQFIGPPLGGFVLAAGGVGWVFLVNAITFAVSFVALRSVPVRGPARREPAAPDTANRARGTGFWSELKGGIGYAVGNRVIAVLLVVTALVNVGFAGPANVGLPLLAVHEGWGAGGIGLLFGGLGAGAALAAAMLGFGLIPWASKGLLLLSATAGQVLCTGLTPFVNGLPSAVALQVGLGFASTLAGTSMLTLIQALTSREMLGRVTSLMYLSMMGLTPVAYAVCGTVVAWSGPRPLFVAGAVVQALGLAVGVCSARVRTARIESQEPQPEPVDQDQDRDQGDGDEATPGLNSAAR